MGTATFLHSLSFSTPARCSCSWNGASLYRLGLASLTLTNTKREASCVHKGGSDCACVAACFLQASGRLHHVLLADSIAFGGWDRHVERAPVRALQELLPETTRDAGEFRPATLESCLLGRLRVHQFVFSCSTGCRAVPTAEAGFRLAAPAAPAAPSSTEHRCVAPKESSCSSTPASLAKRP